MRAEALLAAAPAGADDQLLSTREAAQWFGVSTGWFEIGRCRGWGPTFEPLGPRCTKYRRGTLKKYLQARARAYAKRKAEAKARKLAKRIKKAA
jgi:hypothetical protein